MKIECKKINVIKNKVKNICQIINVINNFNSSIRLSQRQKKNVNMFAWE